MNHNASYDYARLIAAFGIVLFHAQAPGGQVGYAALPFFLMVMLVMAVPGAAHQSLRGYTTTRWSRLMRPWLIWSALYGGLKLVEVALTPTTFSNEFTLSMILTGPAIHLWFLPFAFGACLLVHPLVRAAHATHPVGLACGLGATALVFLGLQQGRTFAIPLAQWTYIAPAGCLGLGFALLRDHPLAQIRLVACFTLVATVLGYSDGLPQLALALAALLACDLISLPRTRASDFAAASAMGVYLVHPLIFSVLGRTTDITKNSLLFALVAAALAVVWATVWPILKSRVQTQAA